MTAVDTPTTYVPTMPDAQTPLRVTERSPLRRARTTIWPYAGLVSGLTAAGSVMALAQGPDTFKKGFEPTVDNVWGAMNSTTTIKLGGGLALVSLVALIPFLLGLTQFIDRQVSGREQLKSALRMASTALVATASIGVVIRYIAAGGSRDGADHAFYTREASTTIATLADQLGTAVFLPGLAVMALVGFAGLRHRLFARPVAALAVLLAAGSALATVVIGLPYSSALVFPIFLVAIGVNGIFSRKAV